MLSRSIIYCFVAMLEFVTRFFSAVEEMGRCFLLAIGSPCCAMGFIRSLCWKAHHISSCVLCVLERLLLPPLEGNRITFENSWCPSGEILQSTN